MNKIHYISFNSFFSHFQIHLYDYLQNLLVWKCYEENKLTHLQLVLWISDFQFLAHLGQRLKWTFLIKICPLMSIIIIIIVIVIDIACLNFSYFICLRTPWPNSTKLFFKAPLEWGLSEFLKNIWPLGLLQRVDNKEIKIENRLGCHKNLPLKNHKLKIVSLKKIEVVTAIVKII